MSCIQNENKTLSNCLNYKNNYQNIQINYTISNIGPIEFVGINKTAYKEDDILKVNNEPLKEDENITNSNLNVKSNIENEIIKIKKISNLKLENNLSFCKNPEIHNENSQEFFSEKLVEKLDSLNIFTKIELSENEHIIKSYFQNEEISENNKIIREFDNFNCNNNVNEYENNFTINNNITDNNQKIQNNFKFSFNKKDEISNNLNNKENLFISNLPQIENNDFIKTEIEENIIMKSKIKKDKEIMKTNSNNIINQHNNINNSYHSPIRLAKFEENKNIKNKTIDNKTNKNESISKFSSENRLNTPNAKNNINSISRSASKSKEYNNFDKSNETKKGINNIKIIKYNNDDEKNQEKRTKKTKGKKENAKNNESKTELTSDEEKILAEMKPVIKNKNLEEESKIQEIKSSKKGKIFLNKIL